jgi:hypothetical protein
VNIERIRLTLEALLKGKDVPQERLDEALQIASQAFDGPIVGLDAEHIGALKLLWAAHQPPPAPSPPSPSRGLVERIRDYANGGENELVLVQDFTSALNNPEACFTLLSLEREIPAACGRILGSGQRVPGMVFETLFTNGVAPNREKLPVPLTDFVAYRGAFLVLAHSPSLRNFERFCVNAVYRPERAALDKARSAYFGRPILTLFGVLRFVGDSEHGECAGIGMKTGEPMAFAES